MDIKEARRICREMANQNQALNMLADAVDAVESGMANVNEARTILASLKEQMILLIEKRDKITQEIVALETHYTNLKNDLETEHQEYVLNHKVKMEGLIEESEEEEAALKIRNNELKGINSNLENDTIDGQKQLDDINAILNSKRG